MIFFSVWIRNNADLIIFCPQVFSCWKFKQIHQPSSIMAEVEI